MQAALIVALVALAVVGAWIASEISAARAAAEPVLNSTLVQALASI